MTDAKQVPVVTRVNLIMEWSIVRKFKDDGMDTIIV